MEEITQETKNIQPIDDITKKILQMSEISLIIDNYDDIFSDFDPRPYSQRALSDDFLIEAKKASKDKISGKIELKFLIPSTSRNKYQEMIIKKRLRDHFNKHFDLLTKETFNIIKQGTLFVMLGIIIMIVTTYILFTYTQKTMFTSFLIVLLEPAGWFLLWEGLNQIIFESKRTKPDLEFYKKMSKCEVTFLSY